MLNKIEAFQKDAEKLGRDKNSIKEFTLWLTAQAKVAGGHSVGFIRPASESLTQIQKELRSRGTPQMKNKYSDEYQLSQVEIKETRVSKPDDFSAAENELLQKSEKWGPLLAARVTESFGGEKGDFWLIAGWFAE